jgi:hypothetical protein
MRIEVRRNQPGMMYVALVAPRIEIEGVSDIRFGTLTSAEAVASLQDIKDAIAAMQEMADTIDAERNARAAATGAAR